MSLPRVAAACAALSGGTVLGHERRHVIVKALNARGLLTFQDIARLVDASDATLRRDLRLLEKSGEIVRAHGCAAPRRGPLSTPASVAQQGHDAAAAIAAVAADMVAPGDTVAFGGGATAAQVARLLRDMADLTVVTNSLLVYAALRDAPNVRIMLAGGLVLVGSQATVGPVAEQSLAGLYVATLFVSGKGLTATRGLSTSDVNVVAVDKCLARSAARVVALADNTKIGVEAMSQTVAPGDLSCVVTDYLADANELDALRNAGVEVIVAPDLAGALNERG